MSDSTTEERFSRTRTVAATPAAVFALLADPTRHQDTEPSDWVRDAVDPEPLTGVGQVFGMNMYLDAIGGAYVMHNRVTVFEPDRAIAWSPGRMGEDGAPDLGGWVWRYDLAPAGDGTEVTLTYDWSQTPQATRDEIGGMPPFPPRFLEKSLDALDRALAG